jgi:hypothetical protein
MSAADGNPVGIRQWIEKASLRLAECEAEGRRLDPESSAARRAKLEARSRRYQSLVDYLREKGATKEPSAPEKGIDPLIALEEELQQLRARIFAGAVSLIRDRARLRDLKTRWGQAVDEYLTEREAQGLPRAPTPSLDFTFPPPPPGAPEEERAAHGVLRSIGL